MKGTLINTPTLETGRLILRKFTERDLEWLFLILHDKEVNQFLPWYPIDSIEEAKKFYEERYASKYVQPQAYAYAICLKTDDHPIGYIKVDMEEHHDFGYGLRREFWHQGLVTEAGKAVIAQVKKDGLPYITATHDRNNPRSGGVMRNVGMKYQYSYEEQWQPKNFLVTFRMYQLNLDGNTDRVYKKYWDQSAAHFIEPNVMDIGEKLGAEAAGLVKTEVLGAWTCLTGSRPIFIQARPMRPHTSQGRLFAP